MQHQRRLLLSTSRLFAHYHTGPRPTIIRTAFVGLKYKKAMPGSPKVGETRPRPDEEDIKEIHELPSSKKRRTDTDKKRKSRKKGRIPLPEPYSSEDVLWREVKALLGEGVVAEATHDGTDIESPYEFLEEVELEIASLTPHGELPLCFTGELASPVFLQGKELPVQPKPSARGLSLYHWRCPERRSVPKFIAIIECILLPISLRLLRRMQNFETPAG